MERLHDACGVVGIYAQGCDEKGIDVRRYLTLALTALQHRGQESAGVASFDGAVHLYKSMGLVDVIFADAPALPGSRAVGHNRYSTCGSSIAVNAGPFRVETPLGPLVLAHNGNIVNAPALRALLQERWGLSPESSSDSELLALLLGVAPGHTWQERILWVARLARGSRSPWHWHWCSSSPRPRLAPRRGRGTTALILREPFWSG